MTPLALGLALILALVFLVQLPPIVAFIRTLRRGMGVTCQAGLDARPIERHIEAAVEATAERKQVARRQRGGSAVAVLERPTVESTSAEPAPRAVCVLCLRGRDPFLAECLRGLLLQEYPDYDVLIVVDSETDPALGTVRAILREIPADERKARDVWIETIDQIYPYCALKGSALIHAARVIRHQPYEVVALLDADTVPHRTWLAELVAPFTNPKIGVTSGNRWYMPKDSGWGSLVRYVWNVGAVVQMFWNHFTWGGSVALRKELFCDRELSARWRRSLSTDTVIYQVAKHHGWDTCFVPTILMVNRESCSLRRLFPWITRQILVGKLYHPGWPWVLGHGLGTTFFLAVAILFAVWALVQSSWLPFFIVLASLLGYWIGNIGIVYAMEKAVAQIVKLQGQDPRWLTPKVWVKLILAMPVTQFFNAVAILATFFVRKVSWRGIVYRLKGRRIEMEAYRPFAPAVAGVTSGTQSL
ncbi:MAG: glycosyltransferase family 2 protein [Thermoguttaceae bacterium]|nr:glycosyltransferase family 2 protein [Thermoguttaceae bacterium]MDW8078791.1 glycosyltransferase family 2 protein [Thermoguttaceae bacterium]